MKKPTPLDPERQLLAIQWRRLGMSVAYNAMLSSDMYLLEDVQAEGVLGIVEGLARWVPERGSPSAAAYWWARSKVSRMLRRPHLKMEEAESPSSEGMHMTSYSVEYTAELEETGLFQRVLEVMAKHVEIMFYRVTPARRSIEAVELSRLYLQVYVLGDINITAAAKSRGISKQGIQQRLARLHPAWETTKETIRGEVV
jgi:hypothetical protein